MFDSTVIKTQNVRQSISETYKGGIVQSSITQFNAASRPTACSVKIVLKGEEHYKVDQHWYSLKENQILLVPAGSSVETNIDSKNLVEGICFYLDFALFSSKDDLLNEESPIIDADWRSDYFKEPINISGTPLLESIQELNQGNPSEDVDYSLYRFYIQFDLFSQVYFS
jgi:gentisate 1,2-dioxygenase